MSILIISHNTRSSGTINITKNLITFLLKQDDIIIITLPSSSNFTITKNDKLKVIKCYNDLFILGFLNRILFDIFIIPIIILKYRPKQIVGIANYFINFSKIPSKIIVRHPYLLETQNLKFLSKKERIIEYMRKIYFNFSLRTTSWVFLQSNYMYELFIAKFPKYRNIASVLPNPISPFFESALKVKKKNDELLFIYPSRYYPHKNHQFILALAEHYKQFFIKNRIRFVITINTEQKSSKFILESIKEKHLSEIILNTGELSQEELVNVYKSGFAVFFPSQAETFGNGLIEGLYMKMPVIAPDLPYAKTILGNSGVYYENDNVESAFAEINRLLVEKDYYEKIIVNSATQSYQFPNINAWWKTLIE